MNELLHIKNYWKQIKNEFKEPRNVKNIKELNFSELKEKVLKNDVKFMENFIYDIYVNKVAYILKSAISRSIKETVFKIVEKFSKEKPSFHKMKDGCPNFHRIIDETIAKNYSVYAVKHSFYLYHWNLNDDPDEKKLFQEVYNHWRIIKYLGGNDPYAYEKNIPSDGTVDRIQIVRYPAGAGELRTHIDPIKSQNIVTGIILTKKGDEFKEGGNYFVNENKDEINIEDRLDVGDSATFYGTLEHGVKKIDPKEKLDWNSRKGRWFLSMFCNDSDLVKNRITAEDLSNSINS